MTWQLALSNLANIPKDTRTTCQYCGSKYEPHRFARVAMYCTAECRDKANKERKKMKACA